VVSPYDPSSQAFHRLQALGGEHPMGTDEFGRDTVSVIGVLAGFYGGRLDDWLMRGGHHVCLARRDSGDRDLWLARAESNERDAGDRHSVHARLRARVVRGSVLAVMQEGYIEAARVSGLADRRVIVRYILSNIAAALIVMTGVYLSTAILTEAGLSYLGLRTQPPQPS
jgi:peptide/nickel transport system permease protein